MKTRHTNGSTHSCSATPARSARCCRARSASRLRATPTASVRERAAALVGALTPVLVWMRDHKGVLLNIDTVRLSFELRSIWKVATKRVFEVRNPITDEMTDIPVPEMPEDLIYPLQAYLGELPSYDMSLDWNRQKSEEPSKQHGFAQFYFTHTFPRSVDPGTLA